MNCKRGFHAGIYKIDHMTNVYSLMFFYLIFSGEQVVRGVGALMGFGGVDEFACQYSCRLQHPRKIACRVGGSWRMRRRGWPSIDHHGKGGGFDLRPYK